MHKIVINSCYGIFNLSIDALQWLKDVYELTDKEFVSLQRHDPRLIECVETLGSEANGPFSELTVIKIPRNKYKIEEYDGLESIVTPEMDNDWITITDE